MSKVYEQVSTDEITVYEQVTPTAYFTGIIRKDELRIRYDKDGNKQIYSPWQELVNSETEILNYEG